jgi:hypothetical protein
MAFKEALFQHSLEATEANHEIPQSWQTGNQSIFEQGVCVEGDEKEYWLDDHKINISVYLSTVYFTTMSPSGRMIGQWWIREDLEWNDRGLIQVLPRYLPRGKEKNSEALIWIAGSPAEVRTRYLSNACQKLQFTLSIVPCGQTVWVISRMLHFSIIELVRRYVPSLFATIHLQPSVIQLSSSQEQHETEMMFPF